MVMRSRGCVALISLILFAPICPSRAEEPADARAIIDRAIRAIGGEARLARIKAVTWKSKGLLQAGATTRQFTSEWAMRGTQHYRKTKHQEEDAQNFTTTLVLKGEVGWFQNRDGRVSMFGERDLVAVREENYLHWLALRLDFTDPALTVSALGKSRADGPEELGIKVTHPALADRELEFLFHHESGLLAKVITRIKGRPPEERFFSDYKEVDGIVHATKVRWAGRNGTDWATQEEERYELQWHAQLDDAFFAAPKSSAR